MLASVVLPVRNQSEHIEQVVAEYTHALRNLSYELILVVNGSTDDSLSACRRAQAAAPSGTIIVLESSTGWGAAVLAGLTLARGDIVGYTNSARTAACDLRRAITLAQTDPDALLLVKATRRYRGSLVRRLGSLLFNLEARTLFHLVTWDVNGTPKLFTRRLLDRIHLGERSDLLDVEVLRASQQVGATVISFDTFRTARAGGRSTTTLHTALKLYCTCLSLALRKPALIDARGSDHQSLRY